ncbi:hypothetical protein CCUS01_03082 [Colletotrichum cuscutae]|uniref:Uncharacterized protein n=2 Tax=Colletotrichum acutatum species complex TaxID=2707335 RepID=A0AAI9YBB4_9PEZI|nr:hypothetical protein CCUS01_03082 [Colletotrichum cuscutae]
MAEAILIDANKLVYRNRFLKKITGTKKGRGGGGGHFCTWFMFRISLFVLCETYAPLVVFLDSFTAFTMSLPAYRHLWRAARIAFKGLDFSGLFEYLLLTFLLSQAMTESSQQRNSRYGKPTDPSYSSAIQKAEDIAKILRENVVQGKQDDSRVFSNILTKTLQNNDSIKMAGKTSRQVQLSSNPDEINDA